MLAKAYVNQDNNIDLLSYSENILVSRDSNKMSYEESAMFLLNSSIYSPILDKVTQPFNIQKNYKGYFN